MLKSKLNFLSLNEIRSILNYYSTFNGNAECVAIIKSLLINRNHLQFVESHGRSQEHVSQKLFTGARRALFALFNNRPSFLFQQLILTTIKIFLEFTYIKKDKFSSILFDKKTRIQVLLKKDKIRIYQQCHVSNRSLCKKAL